MVCTNTLAKAVQHNCHISDAQFAGHYTMCVFLLKMREYFRWEQGIPLSHPLPRDALGEWLKEREGFWDDLNSQSFASLQINDDAYDPFANREINDHLNPLGYVYSGGLGVFHKPYFFLGKLEKKELHDGITLLVSGEELARDLVAPPAMVLDDTVFIRKESLRRVIWERVEEWRMKKNMDSPMARALTYFQLGDASLNNLEAILDRFTDNELEAVFLHETGEVRAGLLLGPQWEELLCSLPRSRAEFLVRAVRDHLADCITTLPTLLEKENHPSLHFYFANFKGLRRELFPEAMEAYQSWIDTGKLSRLKRISQSGRDRWQTMAEAMLKLYRSKPADLEKSIEDICHINV